MIGADSITIILPKKAGIRFVRQRIPFDRELPMRDPEQRVFLQGWINRVEA